MLDNGPYDPSEVSGKYGPIEVKRVTGMWWSRWQATLLSEPITYPGGPLDSGIRTEGPVNYARTRDRAIARARRRRARINARHNMIAQSLEVLDA